MAFQRGARADGFKALPEMTSKMVRQNANFANGFIVLARFKGFAKK
jgi:hypothetical protein